MGSHRTTTIVATHTNTNYTNTTNMKTTAILAVIIGSALCDTNLISAPSSPQFSSIPSSDLSSSSSSFYSSDPYAGYDYDAGYTSLLQGEEDRQDVGFLGGISLAVLVTVFFAALLGALVAPALSAGVSRVMDLEIEIPEIELPKITDNTIEDDDEDVEIIDARSLKKNSPWMKMAQGALSLLEHKLANQNSGHY